MAKYNSNRQQNLKIGISSYTEDKTVLEITGKVGIGTTNATSKLTVVGDVYISGISTLGITSATNLTSQSLVVSGIATINQLDVNQLSPDGSNYGTSLYVPVANGSGGWNWATVASAGAGNLNGIDIREEGMIVGTAGSTTSIDFRGNNIIATGTAGGAIATVRVSDTPTFDSLVVSGVSTFNSNIIQTSGLVGIGTDNPLQKFQIGVANTLGINSEGTIFVVTSNADVGIGTTNPTSKLHVVGNTNIIGTLDLGHASDTTIARSDVGVVTIEGVEVVTLSRSQTLTNKTLTSPTLTAPSLGAATATSVNVSGIITANSYDIGTAAGISTTITGITTTAATAIDSFSTSTYRSSKMQIQITQGTDYQASDVLIIHNGTTANIIEYGSIATNDYLGNFSADISGANARLLVTMSTTTSSTVKVLSQRITI